MTRGARSRPGRLRRLVSALLGALLLSVGAAQDGYGLRPCAHHDAPAGEAGGHAHGDHGSDAGSPAGEPCTCVGACHATGELPAPPLPVESLIPAPEAARHHVAPAERSVLPVPADFLLPYPTAPPLL